MILRQELSNGIEYRDRSRVKAYQIEASQCKRIPKDLVNVLANPKEHPLVQPGRGKIYLGDGAKNPQDTMRYPIYLPPEVLSSHILIAGAIGSGKTSFLMRLLAGAIQHYGSVVISEAKAGKGGSAEGAAFTDIARYLQLKMSGLKVYRWVRGNCWFNPLLYLKTAQDRRAFLDGICDRLIKDSGISGDMTMFIYNAAAITELTIAYLDEFSTEETRAKVCTLRNVVKHLDRPLELHQELKQRREHFLKQAEISESEVVRQELTQKAKRLQQIGYQLEMQNLFRLHKDEFAGSRHGVRTMIKLFDHEDLLRYSEPYGDLPQLPLDDILYNRALVIVSQPLYEPASKIVGSLFWDSLLAHIIELGPNPEAKAGKPRQKVLAVLDETHRLPVGRLGESGDFLREYNLGLVEITPTIVDEERWQQNQHVYQTLISLSPGVPAVVELLQSRLPNFFLKPGYLNPTTDANGQQRNNLVLNANYQYSLSQDNPGASTRSLAMTGRFTGLLQSVALDGEGKVFWLDLEDELLANIKKLLKDAIAPDCAIDIREAVDRALGFVTD